MTIVCLILHKYSQSYHTTAAWRLHPRPHRGIRHVAEYADYARLKVAEARTQARGRPLRGSGRPLCPPQVKRRRKTDTPAAPAGMAGREDQGEREASVAQLLEARRSTAAAVLL